jgi:hypothetical protein
MPSRPSHEGAPIGLNRQTERPLNLSSEPPRLRQRDSKTAGSQTHRSALRHQLQESPLQWIQTIRALPRSGGMRVLGMRRLWIFIVPAHADTRTQGDLSNVVLATTGPHVEILSSLEHSSICSLKPPLRSSKRRSEGSPRRCAPGAWRTSRKNRGPNSIR